MFRGAKLGAGKKSMAFRLTFSPDEKAEKPISPEQADTFFNKIVSGLKHVWGAELR